MKCCPFCAEAIQDAAIKCRYCGEFLDGSGRPPAPPPYPGAASENPRIAAFANKYFDTSTNPSTASKQHSVAWYFRTPNLVVSFLFVGPLMLPLIWWHPTLSRPKKIGLTVIISVVSALLIWGSLWGLQQMKAQYDMINKMLAP